MKWISARDRLPEGILQYEYVLTWCLNDYKLLYYLRDENEWHTGEGAMYEPHEVDSWAELPEKPE